MKSQPLIPILAASLFCAGLAGCGAQRSLTSAETTKFIAATGHESAGKIARLPFQRAWRDASLDPAKYTRIVVRPVTTDYLRSSIWMESAGPFITNEAQYKVAVDKLARHFEKQIAQAFRSPGNRLQLVQDASQPGTLVLEVALTEVVFGHPATYVGSFAVSGGGVAQSALLAPTVAFEARVRDGATGRFVAAAADRRGTKVKLLDLNQLTYNKANEEICTEWAGQFMQAFNRELFPIVKRQWIGVF